MSNYVSFYYDYDLLKYQMFQKYFNKYFLWINHIYIYIYMGDDPFTPSVTLKSYSQS